MCYIIDSTTTMGGKYEDKTAFSDVSAARLAREVGDEVLRRAAFRDVLYAVCHRFDCIYIHPLCRQKDWAAPSFPRRGGKSFWKGMTTYARK